ncbi:MAG: NUDIX domain-containing protein [Lachnospiraceae bacterium]|nr:NUDIX domain-containing protein [Lachnospiraceae bacterium]
MEKYRILVKGIVKHDDQFLIVEHWYDDRIFDPYQWEFIDGELEFGELPDKAVERVIQEKTGLTVSIQDILYTWGFTAGEICTLGIAYLCVSELDEVSLSEDYREFKWVLKQELADYITNKAVLNDIERAGLMSDFELEDFGKVDTFIEHLD